VVERRVDRRRWRDVASTSDAELADLEEYRDDPNVRDAIDLLSSRCPMLEVLGSYPRVS
jgi:prephenate dehydratase